MIWPQQLWIAESCFWTAVAIVLIAFVVWFHANYRIVFPITGKRQNILKYLTKAYVAAEELQMRGIKSEADFSKYQADFARWLYVTMDWIENNMSSAALLVFREVSNVLPINQSHQFSEKHRNYINTVAKHRENLKSLIDSGKWDQ